MSELINLVHYFEIESGIIKPVSSCKKNFQKVCNKQTILHTNPSLQQNY